MLAAVAAHVNSLKKPPKLSMATSPKAVSWVAPAPTSWKAAAARPTREIAPSRQESRSFQTRSMTSTTSEVATSVSSGASRPRPCQCRSGVS